MFIIILVNLIVFAMKQRKLVVLYLSFFKKKNIIDDGMPCMFTNYILLYFPMDCIACVWTVRENKKRSVNFYPTVPSYSCICSWQHLHFPVIQCSTIDIISLTQKSICTCVCSGAGVFSFTAWQIPEIPEDHNFIVWPSCILQTSVPCYILWSAS